MRYTEDLYDRDLCPEDQALVADQTFDFFADEREINDLICDLGTEELALFYHKFIANFEAVNQEPELLRRIASSYLGADNEANAVLLCSELMNRVGTDEQTRRDIGRVLFHVAKEDESEFFIEMMDCYYRTQNEIDASDANEIVCYEPRDERELKFYLRDPKIDVVQIDVSEVPNYKEVFKEFLGKDAQEQKQEQKVTAKIRRGR